MKDPKKYLKQYAALEEAAKAEIIEKVCQNEALNSLLALL